MMEFMDGLFLLFFALTCSTHASSLAKGTSSHGVFLLIEDDKYTFNYSAAQAACLSLRVPMATLAQMQQAVDQGLETCKFGWVEGRVAVVPRKTSDKKCGSGNTGVVKWFASPSKLFGAFCFNPPASTTSSAVSTWTLAATQASTHVTHLLRSTTRFLPSRGPEDMNYPHHTTLKTAHDQKATSGPELPPTPLQSLQNTTSSFTGATSSMTPSPVSVPSIPASTSTVSSTPVLPPSLTSPKSSFGALPMMLTILAVILVVTGAGATLYCKQTFAFGSKRLQNEDVETEMWTPSDSEPYSTHQHGAVEEEEEEDRTHSSDIRLCVDNNVNSLT
ncbi:lymphatic vessel endothelial hyaluronic receptor 1b isoform 1-T1 [Synchiropus picturatus]